MKAQIAALIATAAMVWCAPAGAQGKVPNSEKFKYHKWDVGGSLGILGANSTELGGSGEPDCYCGSESLGWAGNIDVGRYFTQHLKAEAGLMWTTERYFYGSNYSYLQTFPYTSTSRSVQPTTFSGAMTYQFFENVFAHPYLSAGIHVTSFSEESRTYTYNPNFSTPPILSTSSRKYTETRPFVAAGYKSYFNERLYMRSEILATFDQDGFSYATARLGFGFDF